jgi:hypothetical protein
LSRLPTQAPEGTTLTRGSVAGDREISHWQFSSISIPAIDSKQHLFGALGDVGVCKAHFIVRKPVAPKHPG